MKTITSIVVLLVIAGSALAQPTEAEVRAKIAADLALKKIADDRVREVVKRTVWDAAKEAQDKKLPLVVYAGVPAQDIEGTVQFTGPATLDEQGRPGIMYKFWDSDQWYRVPPSAAIRFYLPERKVSQPASPFKVRGVSLSPADGGPPVIADADERWPVGLSFIGDLERYTPAKNTQHTTRRWSGGLGSVSRSSVEIKWNVPGGLVGVSGWKSTLYRSKIRARVYLGRADANDSVSAVTWHRSYPDGATFADVLRNDAGQMFEVRVAEKVNGEWRRYVAFKDVEARPHGYAPQTSRQCAACHVMAGAVEYGAAAIPGGDTVLSDPFDDVERGMYWQGGNGTQL